jgi:hypothetical protein
MLKMKPCCEKCDAPTGLAGTAYICSFECTFCEVCTHAMACICPNCGGELLLRPKRSKHPAHALASQIKNKVWGR